MLRIKQKEVLTRILVPLVPLLFAHCQVNQFAGAGVETTNGRIAGTVVSTTGSPGSHALVKLFPADYDPVKNTGAVPVDTTDVMGRYSFTNVGSGRYTIVSVQIDDKTISFVNGVVVAADTVIVPADTLRRPGSIKVVMPGGIVATNGYCYIPGTAIYSWLAVNNDTVILDSIPACVNLPVYYAVRGNSANPQVIADSVIVLPGGVSTVAYPEWKSSKKLILNTTASGANVPGNVYNFPVLVRLTSSNFNFTRAKSGGEDIRFTKSDGSPLPYEIERWDSAAGAAEIWVKVDTVYGNSNNQYITMFWGNASAVPASASAAVFDTANGYAGVWHLSEQAAGMTKDATVNGYNGASHAVSPAPGVIGLAQQFVGDSSYIQMTGTADSRLNFLENGHYTISAWVYADTLDAAWHMIAGKGHKQYYLKLEPGLGETFSFVEYHESDGWNGSVAQAVARSWKYLTGIRDGAQQYLYLDGALISDSIMVSPDSAPSPQITSDDFSIGKYLQWISYESQGFACFKGVIDEVIVAKAPRDANWVKLCYMNQQRNNTLVVFK
jgi:hypothetical protein